MVRAELPRTAAAFPVRSPAADPRRRCTRSSVASRNCAVLTSRLAEALSGNPQVLLIQGPSGIGKTTLLDEFVASGLGPDPTWW